MLNGISRLDEQRQNASESKTGWSAIEFQGRVVYVYDGAIETIVKLMRYEAPYLSLDYGNRVWLIQHVNEWVEICQFEAVGAIDFNRTIIGPERISIVVNLLNAVERSLESFGDVVPRRFLKHATGDDFVADSETRIWRRDISLLRDLLIGNDNPRIHAISGDASESTAPEFTYYRGNMRAWTIAEAWRSFGSFWTFRNFLAVKYLGETVSYSSAYAVPERLVKVDFQKAPTAAQNVLTPWVNEARRLGMIDGFCYAVPALGMLESLMYAMRSQDERVRIAMYYVRAGVDGRWTSERSGYTFISKLESGVRLSTIGTKRSLNSPPGFESIYHPGLPMASLLERHLDRLTGSEDVVLVRDDRDLEACIVEADQIAHRHSLSKGYTIQLEPDEVRILSKQWRPELGQTSIRQQD